MGIEYGMGTYIFPSHLGTMACCYTLTLVIEIEQPHDSYHWRIIYVRLNYYDSFHVQLERNPKGHTQQSTKSMVKMHSITVTTCLITMGTVYK